jgi:hypothetical protein
VLKQTMEESGRLEARTPVVPRLEDDGRALPRLLMTTGSRAPCQKGVRVACGLEDDNNALAHRRALARGRSTTVAVWLKDDNDILPCLSITARHHVPCLEDGRAACGL